MTPASKARNLVRATFPSAVLNRNEDGWSVDAYVNGEPSTLGEGFTTESAWLDAELRMEHSGVTIATLPEPYFCRQPSRCAGLSQCPLEYRVCND